jgi:predicted ester cyclase
MAPDLAKVFKDGVARIRQAFPDYGGTNKAQVAEREQVTNRFGCCGTHRGEFEDIAPTGKQVEFRGDSTDTVVAGKVVESSVE